MTTHLTISSSKRQSPQIQYHCVELPSTVQSNFQEAWRILPRVSDKVGTFDNKMAKDCTTVEAIQDQVILEQLLNTLPKDMGIFVRERKPNSSLEASMLAGDYLQARKSIPTGSQNIFKRRSLLKCFAYGKLGHMKKRLSTRFRQIT